MRTGRARTVGRRWRGCLGAALLLLLATMAAHAADPAKVLRVALQDASSSAQVAASAIGSSGRSLQNRFSAGSIGLPRSNRSTAADAAGVRWARAMSAIS